MNKSNQQNDYSIFKTMQYLGSKHRSITEIIERSIPYSKNGYILDLFAGSTTVSQAFSSIGKKTISNDIQQFSKAFANATLQINLEEKDLTSSLEKLDKLILNNEKYKYYITFKKFTNKEEKLLDSKNISELLSLYDEFPLIWNIHRKKTVEIRKLHNRFKNNIDKPGFEIGPIATLHYAGSYFGIKQSLDIDYLRTMIEQKKRKEEISNWQYNMFLTCLLTVISKIVFSAGKHFAQPVKAKGIINTPVLNKRLMIDRSYSVIELFRETVTNFIQYSKSTSHCDDNIALNKSMEELLNSDSDLPVIDIIYADPPYTAQQYSRFYHIPEVIIEYKIPSLQIHKGSITKGIYPDNKFKSNFCSKNKVRDAFKDLFLLTRKLDSVLILSYSESKSSSTGNDRMIDLDSLDRLQKDIIPDYTSVKIEFDFEYRQLNKSKFVDKNKDDKEILIVYSRKLK